MHASSSKHVTHFDEFVPFEAHISTIDARKYIYRGVIIYPYSF